MPAAETTPPGHADVGLAARFRRSVRTWLVLAFASLLLLGTLPIGLFTYGRIVALAETEAAAEVRRASDEIGLRIAAMFDPLSSAIGLFRFDPAATAASEADAAVHEFHAKMDVSACLAGCLLAR